MLFENYRNEDLASLYLTCEKNQNFIPMTFHYRAEIAFYFSVQSIQILENCQYSFPKGHFTETAIANWFIVIESYVNCLLKLLSVNNERLSFGEIKKKDFSYRVNVVLDELNCDVKKYHQLGLSQEINEFIQLRNEIFHDRTFDTPLKFNKTKFFSNPEQMNQIDLFEAMRITIDLCNLFRYSFLGLDLMPDVRIEYKNTVYRAKLDLLFTEFLTPYFKNLLNKHSSKTALDFPIRLNFSNFITQKQIKFFPVIKAKSKLPTNQFNQTGTKLFEQIADSFISKNCHAIDNMSFQIPNYIR